jgi:alanine racemase
MALLPPSDPASVVAHVDLGALRHNLAVLRDRAAGLDVMAVVKANAYGHGAVPVTRFLAGEGVSRFGVATLGEAVALREAGIGERILVFAAPVPAQLERYARHDLEVTVTSPEVAREVARIATAADPVRVHIKVDTGMGRIGLDPADVVDTVRLLERSEGVRIEGFWTHFATADEPDDTFAREQWTRFRRVLAELGGAPAPVHAANSGGLLGNAVALDPGLVSGVRLGISLYGLYDPPDRALRPAMSLVSRLTQVKTVPAGTPVSYGATWRAPRETRIGTVSAGYADGYRRALSNRSEVGVAGRRCPIAGRVCMDMIMVDLGPGGEGPPAAVGDEVVLFGAGGPSAFELARWADTITYEIVCGITERVTRRYHEAV